jgi:hypothetical protein
MRNGERIWTAICPALALILGGGMAAETSASAAAAPAAQQPVELACTINGLAKSRGVLTAEAICSRFSQRIREGLAVPVKQTGQVSARANARWIKLKVRLLPRGRAEAALTSRLHGKATDHPLLAVQVMDKPMDLGDIDRLARLAGKMLAGS